MTDDLTVVAEGCGYFTVLDGGGNPQAYTITRQGCHNTFALPMDCERCENGTPGDTSQHDYVEPMFTDLTDCKDGCNGAVTHDGPCPT